MDLAGNARETATLLPGADIEEGALRRCTSDRRDECHTTGLWARPYYHQVPRHAPCEGNEEWKSLQLRWKEEG